MAYDSYPRVNEGSTAWSFVSSEGHDVVIAFGRHYRSEVRSELLGIEIEEEPGHVRITVLTRLSVAAEMAGFMMEDEHATVTLRAPLGRRKLIHAEVNPTLGEPIEPGRPRQAWRRATADFLARARDRGFD